MRTPGADSRLDGAADELLGIIRCLHRKQVWRNLPVLYLRSCSSRVNLSACQKVAVPEDRRQ
jgi:hypothetical protein